MDNPRRADVDGGEFGSAILWAVAQAEADPVRVAEKRANAAERRNLEDLYEGENSSTSHGAGHRGDMPKGGSGKGNGDDNGKSSSSSTAAGKGKNPFTGPGGLQAQTLLDRLSSERHYALDSGGALRMYRTGRYVEARLPFTRAVRVLLGEAFRPAHVATVEAALVAELDHQGRRCAVNTDGLINVPNGILDPATGLLHPHDPDRLETAQFAVEWDPKATCPTFDRWLQEQSDGRAEDLLEASSLMLDRTGRQRKALFLVGPTRSGKGTYLRFLEQIAGTFPNTSAVTLQQLSADRFAAADLQHAVLNIGADVSDKHVEDLSVFKQMTGEDPVRAERKFAHAFTFHCQALFGFSANSVPTVSETSAAYLARVRAYEFTRSYLGLEDPAVERLMRTELPGILVRLVEGLNRFRGRGGYEESPASLSAEEAFARGSDRVRLFLYECTRSDPRGWVTRSELYGLFTQWAEQNGRAKMGAHKIFAGVETAGYRAAKRGGERGFAGLDVRRSGDWGTPDPPPRREGAGTRPEGADTGRQGADTGRQGEKRESAGQGAEGFSEGAEGAVSDLLSPSHEKDGEEDGEGDGKGRKAPVEGGKAGTAPSAPSDPAAEAAAATEDWF